MTSSRAVDEPLRAPAFAGAHLSGASSSKTALVFTAGSPDVGPIKIVRVYEKIGPLGTLFSDERLVTILSHEPTLRVLMVDTPMSLPPCVACVRPSCPGVVRCEDVGTSYMLAKCEEMNERSRPRRRNHRPPLNPQSHRIWDVLLMNRQGGRRVEPGFSANMVPLVVRARTLQRRLAGASCALPMYETSMGLTVLRLAERSGMSEQEAARYRSFEVGRKVRRKLMDGLVEEGLLADPFCDDRLDSSALWSSVETFHAMLASLVAGWWSVGWIEKPPPHYPVETGWVYVPAFVNARSS